MKLLRFDEFWDLLRKKGYQYGFDAADNAYVGYKLAVHGLQDTNENVFKVVAKDLVTAQIKTMADEFEAKGFKSLADAVRSLKIQ